MRIKLKKVLNIIGGFVERGNVIDLPELNAKKLVAMGWAEPVSEVMAELQKIIKEGVAIDDEMGANERLRIMPHELEPEVVKPATRRYKRHDQEDQEATE